MTKCHPSLVTKHIIANSRKYELRDFFFFGNELNGLYLVVGLSLLWYVTLSLDIKKVDRFDLRISPSYIF